MLIIVDADVKRFGGYEEEDAREGLLRRRLSPIDLFCWPFRRRFTFFSLRETVGARPLAR